MATKKKKSSKNTGRNKSTANRAAQKEKDKKKSSSSSNKKAPDKGRYETTDGKKFTSKSDATAHQKKLNAKGQGRGTVDEKPKKPADTTEEEDEDYTRADDTELRASPDFQALNSEDQEAVLAVFDAVASGDAKKANRLAQAFEAASKINEPYFAQQLKLARDAVVRGYKSIEEEADFAEVQAKTRLQDLRKDYDARKEFLTVEEATEIKAIDRQYETDLQDTRQSLAARGFTQSSQRVEKEKLLEDATGDLRTSTKRKFGFELAGEDRDLQRGERNTSRELARLSEITKAGKLDFLRKAEEQLGSKNLPRLSNAPGALGGIYGDIPEQKLKNTIDAAMGFVF